MCEHTTASQLLCSRLTGCQSSVVPRVSTAESMCMKRFRRLPYGLSWPSVHRSALERFRLHLRPRAVGPGRPSRDLQPCSGLLESFCPSVVLSAACSVLSASHKVDLMMYEQWDSLGLKTKD